jgi:hypothetical protein
MEAAFKAILILKPHATLFEWSSISHIPVKAIENAINNIPKNAQRLQYPPSPEQIFALTVACRSFQAAHKTWTSIRNRLYK